MSDLYSPNWDFRIGRTDGPITRKFLHAFCNLASEDGFEVARFTSDPAFVITIELERWIGPYRVDFLISYNYFGLKRRIIVECDGHAFHRQTKQQTTKEYGRARWLRSQGYEFFPFTGSEINASPVKCAAEVLNFIRDFQTTASNWHFKLARRKARPTPPTPKSNRRNTA